MSDPKRQHEWESERRTLERYVADGDIRCVFSQAHLVEMAPIDRSRTELATAKADLLVSLCAGYALPSLDRLVAGELAALRDGRPRDIDVIDVDGNWYPPIDDLISDVGTKVFSKDVVSDAIAEFAGNRAQRRAAAKKLLKKGAPSPLFLRQLKTETPGVECLEIQKTYPMRDEDAWVIARYIRGQARRDEAQRAFEASLRNPRFMMRWFASENVDVTNFTSWLRDSSLKMKSVVDEFAALAKRIHGLPPDQQSLVAPQTVLAKREWDRRPDEMAGRLAQRLADELLPLSALELPLERLHDTCAGFSTLLRTFFDAAWTATGVQPRAPKASDLGDCYHAMYAPYVQIFRPDSFMAPHVARHVSRFGTQVVPKLKQLVPAIEQRLLAR